MSEVLSKRNVGTTDGATWQRGLTINCANTQALQARIAAKYPNYAIFWPTNPVFHVISTHEAATKVTTIQPLNAKDLNETIGAGTPVSFSRPRTRFIPITAFSIPLAQAPLAGVQRPNLTV